MGKRANIAQMSRWWPALAAVAVVVVTALIGLLGNWWKPPPWVARSPRTHRVVFAAALAVLVGLTLVQVLVLQGPGNANGGNGGNTQSPGTRTAAPSQSGYDVFLGDLPPKLGTSNVTQVLPHGLEGRYSRPLVVACPTDPATDRVRDVTYSLAKRYVGFHATLHGFNPTPDESLVQVTLFLDKQDGRAFRFAIGQPQDVDIDVDVTDVDDLRIEVGCQNPSASAILIDPELHHR